MVLTRTSHSVLFFGMVFLGTFICMVSSDWVMIWVGIEINQVGFCSLLIFSGSKGCSEGGIKYFIVQSWGSVLVLISVILWESSGWWHSVMPNGWFCMGDSVIYYLKVMSLLVFGVGLLLKLGSFPFYSWVLQVVSMIDSLPFCFILLTWQKLGPLCLIVSSFSNFESMGVGYLIILMGGVSSLVCGMGDSQIKNLLVYSSISNTGWLILSCAHGYGAFLSYFSVYFIIFLTVFMMLWMVGGGIYKKSVLDFDKDSFVFPLFFVCMLSLSGFPLFLGFLGKWLIVVKLVECGMWVEMGTLMIGSLISIIYYFKLVKLVLKFKGMTLGGKIKDFDWKGSYILFFILLLLFLINFFGGLICFFIIYIM